MEILDEWLGRVVRETTQAREARAGTVGPWSLNLVTHSSLRPPRRRARSRRPLPAAAGDHRARQPGAGGRARACLWRPGVRRRQQPGVRAQGGGHRRRRAGAGQCAARAATRARSRRSPSSTAVREFWDGVVVLGGSLGTGGAVRAAELIGADLAYAGTPFIVAQESLGGPGLPRHGGARLARGPGADQDVHRRRRLVPAREHRRCGARPGRARRQGQDGLGELAGPAEGLEEHLVRRAGRQPHPRRRAGRDDRRALRGGVRGGPAARPAFG